MGKYQFGKKNYNKVLYTNNNIMRCIAHLMNNCLTVFLNIAQNFKTWNH